MSFSNPASLHTALTRRARDMFASGRLHAVRPLLNAARAASPLSMQLDELEGQLLLAEGRVADAETLLGEAIAREPSFVALRLCRADARIRAGNIAGAAEDAAEAVIREPGNHRAKAILGIILIEARQFADAAACLREAVGADPQRVAYRQALAEALERQGDLAGADDVLAAGIRESPQAVGFRVSRLMLALRTRQFGTAMAVAEAAIGEGVVDAAVFGLYGHTLSIVGRHDEAAGAYAEALKLAPEDPYVRHLVSAAGIRPHAARAPTEYLEAVFDGYAERFESHLIGLGYRVPGLIRAEILAEFGFAEAGDAAPRELGPILDLGCGTGLVGVVLSDLRISHLAGVDASSGMLAEAERKGLYAELVHGDIEQMLDTDEREWAIIVAADVFCYFGELKGVLEKLRPRLQRAGVFIFTVEALGGDIPQGNGNDAGTQDWRLGIQGRYVHGAAYIRRIVEQCGFTISRFRREPLRMEAGAEVEGLLIVARRARH
ncbi:tetratricopeptide repeat protein [Limobrevibacterium gyesilva]|uniref:Tetratricopeptide repeat protein n=1 Tax=Limobrevibacterium gyesilva TaxID=2991712 RepID=A0AA41YTY4_9PROT|nr:tetratricopeptide repeat protein [Limobrevibacterium gyesilva]MCW3476513.1 tetratricopeptide repeat protein [Limobrevibacterium gyesilva]